MQSIMIYCLLLGDLINGYSIVKQSRKVFFFFSLVGCKKAQISLFLLFCIFMFALWSVEKGVCYL